MGRAFERRKASIFKTAANNSKLYSKYSKQLYVAAKNGVPDPAASSIRDKHGWPRWDFMEIAEDIRDARNDILRKLGYAADSLESLISAR